MKINVNGSTRDMTEKELAQFEEAAKAIKSALATAETTDNKD